jgi:hypothetical protein
LQHSARRLNGSSREHSRFEVVPKGRGLAIFTAGLAVELKNQRDEESQDEDGKEEGDASFIMPSHRTRF